MKLRTLAVIAFTWIAFEGVASAQDIKTKPVAPVEKTKSSVEVMVFDDDILLDVPVSPTGDSVPAGHHRIAVLLVRPRVTYVPELLKSIENL